MKCFARTLTTSLLLAMAPLGPFLTANAQTPTVTPLTRPTIGAVPTATATEQETHDVDTIEQLMYLVELSRLIGGGISQILGATQQMSTLLGAIRDAANAQLTAITGPKTFPIGNGPDEVSGRGGGTTIRQMVTDGLAGNLSGPPDIASAFSQFATTYKLALAFGYKDSDTLAEAVIAYMAANGAVASSISEHSYLSANASMGRIDGYITALGASPDLKTSVDINTRVNLEVAQQLNEMLRNQAALTTLAGFYFMGTAGVHADMEDNLDFTRLKDMFR
ncbi:MULTISPECIES: type IV secretion system protein [unclassified Ensifer]|uniref:type IV secretion system protein n=1 Tax=unclassified Ensifer TaxID=2633371 RepID=UPI000812CF58|nr:MULTISPECIES: type IV secretion system protein [unclassified Ensifer]OCP23567.1 hypothetical protein BC363_24340 [Ensifer sp. LC384]OCP24254.1 hypothetical protein BC361_20820 [Ensifer sp. LC54]